MMTTVQATKERDPLSGETPPSPDSPLSGTADARRVEAALRPLIECGCAGPPLEVVGPIASRPWSRVFQGKGPAYPTPVAIKLCLDPASGQASGELAGAYFRALSCVHKSMHGHPMFGSARPYALFEDLGVVIAEWVNGPTLSRVITASAPMNARLAARKAGAWLARLHLSTEPFYRPLHVQEMLRQLDVAMTGHRPPPSASIVGGALDALHQTAHSVTGAPVLWTRVHGDFKPDNMLLSDNKLIGIDIDLRWPGPGLLDAAQFLNHLALLFRTPRGVRQLASGGQISAAFRRGYEEDGGVQLGHAQLAWVRLHNAVRLFLKHHSWSPRPVGWITGWSLRQLIAHSTDMLERAGPSGTKLSDRPRRQEPACEHSVSERIAYLEDVLAFLAEDEDTWLSPDADRLLFNALGCQADRKD
jgi:hypothetical protein